jgi:hypothetical protein
MKLMLNDGVENARILSEKLDSGDPVGSPQSPGKADPWSKNQTAGFLKSIGLYACCMPTFFHHFRPTIERDSIVLVNMN